MIAAPLVSVIIPTFNVEDTIVRCLESIVSQTLDSYEIFIMDGGSSDRTLQIVSLFAERYPNIKWESKKDGGIYYAMRDGVKVATGRWILFMGADDLLYDAEVFKNTFREPIPANTLAIYGKALVIPDQIITPLNVSFDGIARANLCHQSIFYSKNVFEKLSYNLKYRILADWDLNLRLFARYFDRILVRDVFVCRYLNLGVSADWKQHEEFKKHFANVTHVYLRYLPLHLALARILRPKVARVFSSLHRIVEKL